MLPMYTKNYMYDPCRKNCMELLEGGFVEAFEETLLVLNRHPEFHERQSNLQDDLKAMEAFVHMMKKSEDFARTGSIEDSFHTRMELAHQFSEEKGYYWLAEYIYKSCSKVLEKGNISDADLEIDVLKSLANLEERRNNMDSAMVYMEKACKVAQENSFDAHDPKRKDLNQNLIHIYLRLGNKYLKEENADVGIKNSMCVLYAKKAAQLAKLSGVENKIKATCYALLGKVMLKYKDTKRARKNFESYLQLSKDCNNPQETCNAYYVLSEVLDKTGDLLHSREAALKCQELAKENNFLMPAVFSSIKLGQLETAMGNFFEANQHFEDAFKAFRASQQNSPQLERLCRAMCGIGRANINMAERIDDLLAPEPAARLLKKEVAFIEDITMGEEQGQSLVAKLVEEELATQI